MSLRDLLELCALGLFIAAGYLAAGLWPSLLIAGGALGYLSHAWEWGEVKFRGK